MHDCASQCGSARVVIDCNRPRHEDPNPQGCTPCLVKRYTSCAVIKRLFCMHHRQHPRAQSKLRCCAASVMVAVKPEDCPQSLSSRRLGGSHLAYDVAPVPGLDADDGTVQRRCGVCA